MFNKRKTQYKSSLEYEPLLPEHSAFVSRNEKMVLFLMAFALFICGAGILFSITFISYILFSAPVVS